MTWRGTLQESNEARLWETPAQSADYPQARRSVGPAARKGAFGPAQLSTSSEKKNASA